MLEEIEHKVNKGSDECIQVELLLLRVRVLIANLFLITENYPKSIEYSTTVIRSEPEKNTQNHLEMFAGHCLLIQSYLRSNNLEAAYISAEKAAIFARRNTLESVKIDLLINIAADFEDLDKLNRALETLKEAAILVNPSSPNSHKIRDSISFRINRV